MGKLTGQTIAASYDQLLIVDHADGISASLQAIESADTGGSASSLKISTSKVEVIPASDSTALFEVSKNDGTPVLSVDTSNARVGINTDSPDYAFEVESSGTFSKIAQTVYRDSDKGNYLDIFFSRGTVGSPAVVQNNDELFTLRVFGYNDDGTAFDQAGAIIFSVDGSPSDGDSSDMPGRIEFWTTPNGSETPAEAMRIEADNTVVMNGALQPAGNVTTAGDLTVNGGDVTISNSSGHANLNINANADEGADSAIAFRSGTTERGYIYYDHNTTAASQKMVFNVGDNAVTAMTIAGNGNTGIGETSPDHKLHLAFNGDTAYNGATDLDGESIMKLEGTSADGEAVMIRWSNHGAMNNYFGVVQDGGSGPGDFVFTSYDGSSAYAEKVRIKGATGRLGLGESSPNNIIHAAASTNSTDGGVYPTIFAENSNASGESWAGFKAQSRVDGSTNVVMFALVDGDGEIGFVGTNSNHPLELKTNGSERVHITAAGTVVTREVSGSATNNAFKVSSSNGSYATSLQLMGCARGDSDAWKVLTAYHGDGSNNEFNDVIFEIEGNGDVESDSGTYGTGASDYAEYFESKDGKEIAVGKTVKLDGGKVVACEDGDTPMGVVRPKQGACSVIGNKAQHSWHSKWLKNDYDEFVLEDCTVTEWTEKVHTPEMDDKNGKTYKDDFHSYETDKIPSDVTVPDDAKVLTEDINGIKLQRKILNPDYNSDLKYEAREKRDSWCLIGLLGQVPITKGQPVSSSWIKMKDVSDTVEMYFVK